MRIDTYPAPVELAGALSGQAGGTPPDDPPGTPRTVAGLAVPYEVEATVMMGGWPMQVTFADGSIDFPASSPLLFGHDTNQPVGVLRATSDVDGGVRGEWAIDPTPTGDAAIAQARSGSRRGLSVGVDVDRFEASPDDPDRIRVLEGRAVETSLVALAAYPTAGVDQVAAGRPTGGPMPEPTATPTPPAAAPEPIAPAVDVDAIAAAVADRLEATGQAPRLVVTEPDRPPLRLGEYLTTWIRANRGDAAARERLEAQLTRQTTATEGGVVPVAYVQQIIDSLGAARPLFGAFSTAEMPPAGMLIRRPEVTARPSAGWYEDETLEVNTGPLTIASKDTSVEQWAWGGAASIALVERSMPSYVEEAFTQMVKAYYRDVEAKIAGQLPTAAGTATTIGGAVAQYVHAYRDFPDTIVAGGAAYGAILDSIGLLRFSGGSADAAGQAQIFGMKVAVSADVAPADLWVTDDGNLENRESTPLRLTVADVGGMSMEIGLTAFFASTVTAQDLGGVTGGAVHVVGYTPAREADAGGETRRK